MSDNNLQLCEDENGLYLTDGVLTMRGDLSHMASRIKKGILGCELLVRAARLKDNPANPVLIDATAGMGEDSLLLAAAGFNVRLYEYDHIIASLLKDSIRRASLIPELQDAVSRMEVIEGDSISAMTDMSTSPAVIYLDPMFPERTKTAMIKKKFQLLQQLELPCSNEEELLNAAISAKPRKIVIKRPLKGPFLAGIKPGYSISGKAIRYDCLVFPENNK